MLKTNYPQNLVEVVLGHPNNDVDRRGLAAGVAVAMITLGERLGEIIRLRYGASHSYEVLSSMMHLPAEEIERLEKVAIKKLQEPQRKDFFEKGIVARLGDGDFSEDYKKGFAKGYLQYLEDQNEYVSNPLARIEFDNPDLETMLDISHLGISDRAVAWLHSIGVTTIEKCMGVTNKQLLSIDVRDSDLLIEIAQKLNEYGIHYSDWDDFL